MCKSNNHFLHISKQRIQSQSHTYLSEIRDLQASDAEENHKKKREQQIAFAESLRKQIDEKRQRKQQQQNQKYRINQFKEGQQRNEPQYTFGEDTSNILHNQPNELAANYPGNNEDISFSANFELLTNKPTRNIFTYKRKQIFTKADLSQFDLFSKSNKNSNDNYSFYINNQIRLNTDSPFATSTVPTPPHGFSMRRLPIAQPTNSLRQTDQEVFRTTNHFFDNSSLSNCQNNLPIPHQQKSKKYCKQEDFESFQVLPNKITKFASKLTKKTNYKPPQVQPRAKSMLLRPVEMKNAVPLSDVSELVYPDGHLSPAISPRDFSF